MDPHFYHLAILKGEQVASKFDPRQHVNRSEFLQFYEVAWNGWERYTHNPHPPDDDPTKRMYDYFGLSKTGKDNTFVRLHHKNKSVPKVWDPTDAVYECVFHKHAIIATKSESPDYCSVDQDHMAAWQAVPLKHWSDVVFLHWEDICRHSEIKMRDLRFILQTDILNSTTRAIIRETLRRAGLPIESTARFGSGSQGYHALLSSPLGVGPAHFHVQHCEKLGCLKISAIHCFSKQYGRDRTDNLCFQVGPA